VLWACGESKPPVTVRLAVAEDGMYSLDRRSVPEGELQHELRSLRSAGTPVLLEIDAHPFAKHEAVGKAVKAAQDAGIDKLAFVTSAPASSLSSSAAAPGASR